MQDPHTLGPSLPDSHRDVSGTDGAKCLREAVSRSKIVGTIRPLVNAKILKCKCKMLLCLLYYMLKHCYEGKKRSKIKTADGKP